MVASIGATIIFTSPDYYLAAHLSQTFHTIDIAGVEIFGQRMLSIVTMVNTFMIVLMMGMMTKLFKHWSEMKASAVGTALQGGSFAIMFLLTDFWPLMVFTVILTLGEMIVTPASQSLRAEMMNPEKIGAYSGFSAAIRPIGAILASGIVSASVLVGNIGAALLLLTATGISILFTYLAVLMLRENRTS